MLIVNVLTYLMDWIICNSHGLSIFCIDSMQIIYFVETFYRNVLTLTEELYSMKQHTCTSLTCKNYHKFCWNVKLKYSTKRTLT